MRITLPEFAQAKVLVVGDVMLDRYWHGPTGRISPEAPVPVVKVEQIEERPGGAANVALNAVALGAGSTLLGMSGEDEAGLALENQLATVGVECQFTKFADYPTITKLRVLSRHQQLIRLDFEENFHEVDSKDLTASFAEQVKQHQVVILSDYNKGALNRVGDLIALAREAGVPVLVDPKGSAFDKYRGATLLTPNYSEFEAVVGPCKDDDEIISKGLALIEQLDLEALLVTRSEHGMTLIRKGEAELHLAALAQEVYDVTGAGDTVISTLASSLAAGASLDDACALANAAAGIVVGKLGTSTVSTIELANAVYGSQETGFGVLSEQQLKFALEAAKRRGETVVMTNGCFDILHAGHVSYLNHARTLGDRLIVAVNNDDSVKRLKGEGRPVNSVDRRMAVLAGLGAVDWVVDFSEDTPQRLIANLLPDLLVKGGDYKPEEIAGGEEVIANGGQVKVLNFEDGCSTSEIIKSIRQNQID
ncbi:MULTISPECIES: bifunctional D-glycero-beta-D-manno-heptose-7-phosphate kinase/D-glycero-beta-D-manno-heptose 1-phosphate adenylyltransferase HldE [unclassified Agarivorans]|uniref:bifunctional D-glycero-beta-D-manno-heptose-7-phosphate kinase/D-glycero-beta-D-manno-heptose 1-phosphate adenylyltransferase HldE n=1 Tax=unclassified Agarivorans TaxID=2636026 RepID=UPI0026E14BE0|nr:MULTISPECIES: bifunctional D-glycero-beta-D-manno-heptose-7-phosphate kinase/D-glycero-beta-D-manno-heptose 1-phosphate adenylyltransferase HldE [unclassified Agarivorans]MDO6685241.1 bifunctional D-glycero-beta-D-manno-heptose-7-phosphate kinase/D-glycero-beta-D-manno-heptose 1-phosphate adenylyltransferase HldE [Agarivorans sp. 3_MG-2023]MDO6715587.1 bifunctional D-glycero-beta-D-manno-heptose-7-phosphate kinase/D-glycero-beta-D-manno-heptose 1-phosphate adenylyltransferase HldE [Agarivorans